MNGASAHPVGTAQPWKQFYRAALLVKDPERFPLLIDQAEKAIVVRARELFQASGGNGAELEALEDAVYGLHSFRSPAGPPGTLRMLNRAASNILTVSQC